MKLSPLLLMLAVFNYSNACLASAALLKVLDRDDNGYLTLDETGNKPQIRFRFSQIDRNQNDRLEMEEMQLVNIPPAFGDFDTDQSLGITPEEASALRALQNQFSRLDQNEDQMIDPDEFGEFRAGDEG